MSVKPFSAPLPAAPEPHPHVAYKGYAVPLLSRRAVVGGGVAASLASGQAFAAPHTHVLGHLPPPTPAAPLHAPALTGKARPTPPLVMLDPGHGGKDPGAIGFSGTYEKHVAEAAAAELARQLMATGRYRVAMTRTSDRFIPLDGRVELAQKHGASLFISMHADALHNASVRGASVYTHSHGASDSQTAALARTENDADRFGGPLVQGASPEVQQILASLVTEEARRGSLHMANAVVSSFRSRINLLPHPQRHAAFAVLKSAQIPSVLVEMGFMSNRLDEAALRQAGHRAMVAGAMCTAVNRYFASAGVGLAG
ncbi:N-acetylmuramoyl-L-alanine amidase family protein [Acetobacter orientalis]|uniref:N-acetylmuramoyl-L-alanine amidase family protein n=1 Tax=Acetobacter orientalis TaxID=146474 RepID=UPI00209FCC37|nr:N-acetylmuramoyl-L-alanine amidase [Acetobacter orientalis]MCP1215815.1 N-acetylmuramoyl-L-alanine amidase [Acetobacter orientalis]MCP1218025.1 N-acetylmuramoyl-L-alanine amidase [Acetobacter orientalis]MCP1221372.1 N-acetylmuramoyl-L-alanine amidase [Acetobacter orientalis]